MLLKPHFKMLTFTLRCAHQVFRGFLSKPVLSPEKAVVLSSRCWPLDCDVFLHMNNANYLTNAELTRWRTLPACKLISRATSKEGLLFLAAENDIKYYRPLNMFQRYVISSTCRVGSDDKWFYYTHTFHEHPNDAKGDPKKFATVELKAVVKERSGKTIKPSTLLEDSDFYREWVTCCEVDKKDQ